MMAAAKEVAVDIPRSASSESTINNDQKIELERPVEAEIDAEANLPSINDPKQPEPPPNGGLLAWLQVLG